MAVTCRLVRVPEAEFEARSDGELFARCGYGQPGVLDLDAFWDPLSWLTSQERRER